MLSKVAIRTHRTEQKTFFTFLAMEVVDRHFVYLSVTATEMKWPIWVGWTDAKSNTIHPASSMDGTMRYEMSTGSNDKGAWNEHLMNSYWYVVTVEYIAYL